LLAIGSLVSFGPRKCAGTVSYTTPWYRLYIIIVAGATIE